MRYCTNRPDALAWIQGGMDAPGLSGWVRFFQENGRVLIVTRICGLPDNETGFFGFHIHQDNSCSDAGFPGTGIHYSSPDQPHPKHDGDLPPLLRCQGNAYMILKTDRFSVKDVIGRTIVIHIDPDDFYSQPSGNAGRKIACGVIRQVR